MGLCVRFFVPCLCAGLGLILSLGSPLFFVPWSALFWCSLGLPVLLVGSIWCFERFRGLEFIFLAALIIMAFLSSAQIEQWGGLNVGVLGAILWLVYFYCLPRCRCPQESQSAQKIHCPAWTWQERMRAFHLVMCMLMWVMGPAFLLSSSLEFREKALGCLGWFCMALALSYQEFWAVAMSPEVERYKLRKALQSALERERLVRWGAGSYIVLGLCVLILLGMGLWL